MGMYDNLRCNYPLPGDPGDIEFQTKSFDSFLNDYRITESGELLVEEYDIEDRSDPNAKGIMRIVGMMTRIPKGWKLVDFTGVVNFYGDKHSGKLLLISREGTKMLDENGKEVERPAAEWFEFNATIDHGTLVSVERCETGF